jgi:protein-L-isoaspartate(D-aspartate) O-methyltransferase
VVDLEAARAAFADGLMERCSHGNEQLRRAFRAVPREAFLGAPPWRIRFEGELSRREETSDPADLYRDVLVAIDPDRSLNNGAPSLWATAFDGLRIAPGEQVVHVGCGTGYYSAILAETVGSSGGVLAIEVDPVLSARARENLRPWPWVQLLAGDGAQHPHEAVDVIVVNAGATQLVSPWLDGLRPGGRLYAPLTINLHDPLHGLGLGAALIVERRADGLGASFANPIGIYPCTGARTAEGNAALHAAFGRGPGEMERVRSVRRDAHEADHTCWCHTAGACISTAELGS